MDSRYAIDDPFDLLSPSLVIFRVLVRKNLGDMITMARGPDRLQPHVKTHKMAAIVRMAAELVISNSTGPAVSRQLAHLLQNSAAIHYVPLGPRTPSDPGTG